MLIEPACYLLVWNASSEDEQVIDRKEKPMGYPSHGRRGLRCWATKRNSFQSSSGITGCTGSSTGPWFYLVFSWVNQQPRRSIE